MSPPRKRNGPLEQGPAVIVAAAKRLDHTHPSSKNREIPVVTAEAYPPAGRRTMWLLLVKSCPFYCGYSHAHRGSARGGLREAGCGRGEYILRPVVASQAAA